jgi:hypothetical protein
MRFSKLEAGKGTTVDHFSRKRKSHEYDLQAVLREFGDSSRRWRRRPVEVCSNANRRRDVRDKPVSKVGRHALQRGEWAERRELPLAE